MSRPASACWRTASATDARSVWLNFCRSGGSVADNSSRSSGGRIKLPTKVVRMRSLLRFTARSSRAGGDPLLQEPRGPHHRAPHVGHRTVVETKAFLRLAEVAAENIDEIFQMDFDIRVKRIQVVDRDQPAGHIPLVLEGFLVGSLDVRLRLVVGAEVADVLLGVGVADRLVGVEAQRLVGADGPGDLLIDVRLDELRAPVAVVGPNKADHADVVQQAGGNDLFIVTIFERQIGALEQMLDAALTEPQVEEIEQRRLIGHFRQTWVWALEKELARLERLRHGANPRIDIAHGVQR